MFLKSLVCSQFKNHCNLNIELSPNVNLIVGKNGAGKTNILDSIHYLSTTKSYFYSSDIQSIKYGEDYFTIQGVFFKSQEEYKIDCCYNKYKKIIKQNGVVYEKIKEHLGLFPVVIISPDDIDSIKGAAESRRKLFDSILCQFNKEYLQVLIEYNSFLKQRNALLKQDSYLNNVKDEALLNHYDEKLLSLGKFIFKIRKSFIDEFVPYFKKYYLQIANSKEKVDIGYNSQLSDPNFENIYFNKRSKDILLRHTSMGIHRDDYLFTINGNSMKISASQGQKKSFMISLKLAQNDILNIKTNIKSLLLLDDIFEKLDNIRVHSLIEIICEKKRGQVFITDAIEDRITGFFKNYKLDKKIFCLKED